MTKTLEILEKYTLYIVVAVFAVFVLPYFAAPFVIPKEILLIVGVGLVLLLWIVRNILKGSTNFAVGKFDLGVFLIAAAYLVSSLVKTPNKMDAFLFPGTTTFVLAGAVLYFVINQLDKRAKTGVSVALFVSGLLLSLSVLFTQLGVLSKIPQLPAFIKDVNFNPLGGALPSIIYLGIAALVSVFLIVEQKDFVKKVFFGVATLIILFGGVVLVTNSLPGKDQAPKFPSFQTSWEVSVDALKASPLFGVGPSNYLTAFNLYRPISYNKTDLWGVRFTTGSNFYFTLLTEVGFAGLLAFAVLFFSIYRSHWSNEKASLVLLLVLFAIFPVATQLLFLLFVLLAIYSRSEEHVVNIVPNKISSLLVSLPILAGIAAIAFFGSKVLAAEVTFKQSLDALSKNDAKSTYDLMTKAVNQNPKVDRYHASLAQVNMALASSLANKKDLTDADKKTVTQLVQQAINEGKNTVILNPQRSSNWEILGQIYRNIMPFAQGADNFAIQTYTQAVALDPINPNLRIALGGVYYALGKYDNAIETFKLAVVAKPDLANAHYNLAIAYREKKDIAKATEEMNTVLSLVGKNSADYEAAKKELEKLESLTTPKAVETSNIKPPIILPQEAVPPTQ